MKKKIKFFLYFFICGFFYFSNSIADNIYFIDISKVLNQSKAGADAQNNLKKKFEAESKKFSKQEEILRKEETDLISQKKALSNEEYQNKLNELRKKVASLQNDKQKSLSDIARSRASAKQELLKNLNPILKKYMEDNNVRVIVEKQSVVLGDTTLEISDQIIEILNKQLSSININ